MKYLILPFFFIGILQLNLMAQPITGTIRNAVTNEPMPYTNIGVLGTNKGSVSNLEGKYVLDMKGITVNDIIVFSYVGFETYKISGGDLQKKSDIFLQPATINLQEIQISSKNLTVKQILALVEENYQANYPPPSQKQRIFYHKYEVFPFPDEKQMVLKKSDFVGMDKATYSELFDLMPSQFIDYQDAVLDTYSYNGKTRINLVEGISLSEGGQEDLWKKMEEIIVPFVEDIKESYKEEGVYYKFRTGIIGKKIKEDFTDEDGDDEEVKEDKDSLNYTISTSEVKGSLNYLTSDYANIESKNWEFITKPGKYKYNMEGITIFNDELVYEIDFRPKGGLFEGKMYISTSSYALLQLDFAYAPGKRSERIQLLGFGHSMNYKKGRVIYEKREDGYYVKYISAQQQESVSVDRNFVFMKKKKRFLFDKQLSQMKLVTHLTFDMESFHELLVLDREEINEDQYESIEQPKKMKYKMQFVYSPEMWENPTVISPASELQKYKRAE